MARPRHPICFFFYLKKKSKKKEAKRQTDPLHQGATRYQPHPLSPFLPRSVSASLRGTAGPGPLGLPSSAPAARRGRRARSRCVALGQPLHGGQGLPALSRTPGKRHSSLGGARAALPRTAAFQRARPALPPLTRALPPAARLHACLSGAAPQHGHPEPTASVRRQPGAASLPRPGARRAPEQRLQEQLPGRLPSAAPGLAPPVKRPRAA